MKRLKALAFLVLCVLLATAILAQSKAPKITVSPQKVLHPYPVQMKGTGFSPKSDVLSHLRRPDGTEFRILEMYTNNKGEIDHEIDTIVMVPGVYDLWVEDPKAKTTSNVAHFEVTHDPKDLEK
jgi:hypothetical protein